MKLSRLMLLLALLLPALLLPALLPAQQFVPGDLITLDGDTMSGLVAKATGGNYAYKANTHAEKNYFKEEALSGYSMGNERYERHLVDVLMGRFPERRNVFCKVLVYGPVKLLEYTGGGIVGGGTFTNHFLEHVDAEMPFRVPPGDKAFRSQMSMYFEECEELAAKIKSRELGYDQLSDLVLEYNNWAIRTALQEKMEAATSEEDEE